MTETIEVKVPDIGDFSDVPVIEVLVSAGDHVDAEDSLITLESDKATMEVPSPRAGIIREVKVKLDDRVAQGDVVVLLDPDAAAGDAGSGSERTAPQADSARSAAASDRAESRDQAATVNGQDGGDESIETKPAAPSRAPGDKPAQANAHDSPPTGGDVAVDSSAAPYASPAVRQFARELGVDLAAVKGTGSKGRIQKEDVAAHVKSVMGAKAVADTAAVSPTGWNLPPPPKLDFSAFGEVIGQPLSRIGKLSAGHLHRNWLSIPHVTQHDEADITDMERFRKSHAAEAEQQGFKLTPLVFLIKASVAALRKFPQFNASLDASGENLLLKQYFNIGIAVDTPDGLVVPVLRACERKGLMELGRELGEVSKRARERKLKPQDIQGGCFSISSLGGIGGTAFTPIINAPEVAILGVSRSRMSPVWDGEQFNPRLMLPLSLSYDHRVIDGAAAARFTRYLGSCLEDLRQLTL